MLKKLVLASSFCVLIFSLSACTLTEPGLEKNISRTTGDSNVTGSPEMIKLDEPSKNKDTLHINKEDKININEKDNMANKDENKQEDAVAATKATIKTSKGDIVIKLEADSAPSTVKNFASKSSQGFYNDLIFHRVEDWVIQGGDPDGNGTGGGKMPTEINQLPFTTGSVGIARGGDIAWSNDSQFFICTTDCNWLTGQYTNFGQVVEGMEIVKQIAIGDVIQSITTE